MSANKQRSLLAFSMLLHLFFDGGTNLKADASI